MKKNDSKEKFVNIAVTKKSKKKLDVLKKSTGWPYYILVEKLIEKYEAEK